MNVIVWVAQICIHFMIDSETFSVCLPVTLHSSPWLIQLWNRILNWHLNHVNIFSHRDWWRPFQAIFWLMWQKWLKFEISIQSLAMTKNDMMGWKNFDILFASNQTGGKARWFWWLLFQFRMNDFTVCAQGLY